MSKSSLMDLMNTDFSDEDSEDDQESQKLFEKYGNAFPIHEAIECGDSEAIPTILKKSGKLDFNPEMDELVDDITIDQRDQDECTPLHLSIMRRDLKCVKECLEQRASLGGPTSELLGAHPLHLAITASAHNDKTFAFEATGLILGEMNKRAEASSQPISVHALRDAIGRTPLHVAVAFGALKCTNALLRNCKSKDAARKLLCATNNNGQTVLHVATERANRVGIENMKSVVSTLLKASKAAGDAETTKLFVNIKDERGITAIQIARAKKWTHGENMLSEYDDKSSSSSSNNIPTAAIGVEKTKGNNNTLVMTHPICVKHLTCEPSALSRNTKQSAPSENIRRLTVLCAEKSGALRASEFEHLEWKVAPRASMADVLRVHDYAYVSAIQRICNEMEGDDAKKTNARTRNIDHDSTVSKESYDAGLYAHTHRHTHT